jgi:hypothetical protein
VNELITNWIKIVAGVCAVIAVAAWGLGHVTTNDLIAVLASLFAAHATSSGVSGLVGGPTQNNTISQTDVTRASRGANG